MKKILSKKGGFTLIELLVVISIIGLLSSIVLASVSTARDKGKIAAGQTFNSHNFQAFGADSVVFLNFDSSSAVSESQYSFTSTLNPNNPSSVFSDDTNNGKGKSFRSLATFGYIKLIPSSPITVGTSGDGKFTASAWVKTSNVTSNGFILSTTDDSLCTNVSNRAVDLLRYSNGKLQAQNNTLNPSDANIPVDLWTHVAYSWDGTKYSFYINGKLTDSIPNSAPTTSTIGCLIVGNYGLGGIGLNGYLDDVAIYNSSLASKQIEQIYAQGLSSHTLVDNK